MGTAPSTPSCNKPRVCQTVATMQSIKGQIPQKLNSNEIYKYLHDHVPFYSFAYECALFS